MKCLRSMVLSATILIAIATKAGATPYEETRSSFENAQGSMKALELIGKRPGSCFRKSSDRGISVTLSGRSFSLDQIRNAGPRYPDVSKDFVSAALLSSIRSEEDLDLYWRNALSGFLGKTRLTFQDADIVNEEPDGSLHFWTKVVSLGFVGRVFYTFKIFDDGSLYARVQDGGDKAFGENPLELSAMKPSMYCYFY